MTRELHHIKSEIEYLLDDTVCLIKIKASRSSLGFEIRLREESHALLEIVERIVLNAQRGRVSRIEYADGQGSLASCIMRLQDIDDAIAVVRKIRGE